jgi:hypothetical protein
MSDFTKIITTFFVFVVPGLFLLGRGIWMLKGGAKAWYFARHLYAGGVYAQIPLGITFLWFAIATMPESHDIQLLFVYVGSAFGIVGVVFNFLRPSFLKPAWLKRLERQHSDIMPILDKEANEMGLETWEKYVDNRGLDVWVAEVRRKHGRDRAGNPFT